MMVGAQHRGKEPFRRRGSRGDPVGIAVGPWFCVATFRWVCRFKDWGLAAWRGGPQFIIRSDRVEHRRHMPRYSGGGLTREVFQTRSNLGTGQINKTNSIKNSDRFAFAECANRARAL